MTASIPAFTKANYQPEVRQFHFGRFRYGKSFTYFDLRFMAFRDPMGYFLTRGIAEEALGRGFTVVDPKNEGQPVKWNDDLQKLIVPLWDQLLKGAHFERAFGDSVLTLTEGSKEHPILRAFEPENFDITLDKEGDPEAIQTREKVRGRKTENIENYKEGDLDLADTYFIQLRQKTGTGWGLSILEPVFDEVFSLYSTRMHQSLRDIREGGVMHMVYVEASVLGDETKMAKLEEGLINYGSADSTIFLPKHDDMKDAELVSPSSPSYDFASSIQAGLERISVDTGIPAARLRGIEPGQQEGAEVNEKSYFDVLERIQDDYMPIVEWMVNRLAELNEWEGEFAIEFNNRRELSEEKAASLLATKIANVAALVPHMTRLGIDNVQLLELCGIDIEVELVDPEELMPDMGQGQDEGEEREEDDDSLEPSGEVEEGATA